MGPWVLWVLWVRLSLHPPGDQFTDPDKIRTGRVSRVGKIDQQDFGNDCGSFGEDDNPVSDIDRLFRVMRNHNDGRLHPVPDPDDLILEFPPRKRVEGTERLVH